MTIEIPSFQYVTDEAESVSAGNAVATLKDYMLGRRSVIISYGYW
ncbi:MAG: hypothetical protein ACXV3T_02165 [Halobacteriota archaeon]